MQLEIHAEHDLHHHHEHQRISEGGMDVFGELATFMGVAEEVGDDCDDRSDNLKGHMPPGAYDL